MDTPARMCRGLLAHRRWLRAKGLLVLVNDTSWRACERVCAWFAERPDLSADRFLLLLERRIRQGRRDPTAWVCRELLEEWRDELKRHLWCDDADRLDVSESAGGGSRPGVPTRPARSARQLDADLHGYLG